ncbi:unnamed protein product, partial [marine sediment metagenome]
MYASIRISKRDLARLEQHLTDADISDTNASTLFNAVLKIYSRFRGEKSAREITFVADEQEYDLTSGEDHILSVFWNDTYPDSLIDVVISGDIQLEQYHNPALILVEKCKQRLRERMLDETEQPWHDYYKLIGETDTHKLHIGIKPETNIVIETRKKFTNLTFPQNDEDILKSLLQAKMLGYIKGVMQVKSQGDVTFNIAGMTAEIKRLEKEFYTAV